MTIAALLTCHNRKEKTLACLASLFVARDNYKSDCELRIYLTDDGCTDGTPEAVRESYVGKDVIIISGDGNLYWAGGMRKAWKKALEDRKNWDFFLLLNDDVVLNPNCLSELMETHQYSLEHSGKAGVYSGITYSTQEPRMLTYSGCVWTNRFWGTMRMLDQTDKPQLCDVTNANILLIDKTVYEKIGIFYEGFIHGGADHDYSHQAKKAGFPVWVTANCCGFCDDDHLSNDDVKKKLLLMTLKERKRYFANPVNCINDYILGIKRRSPQRYLLAILGRYMNLYCPRVYYFLSGIRTSL